MNVSDLLKNKEKIKELLEHALSIKNKKLAEVLIPLVKDPQLTYLYAHSIVGDKIKSEWEKIILQNPMWTYLYTFNVLGKRWKEGEKVIVKDAWVSYMYAKSVVKDRWEEGEEIISKDAWVSYMYAKLVVKDRWKKGEWAIVNSTNFTHIENYAIFLKVLNKLEEFLRDYPEVKKYFDFLR
jgi:hypothetical protein